MERPRFLCLVRLYRRNPARRLYGFPEQVFFFPGFLQEPTKREIAACGLKKSLDQGLCPVPILCFFS